MPNPKKKERTKGIVLKDPRDKAVSPQRRADDKMFKSFSFGQIVRGKNKEKARKENQKAVSRGMKPSTSAKPGRLFKNRMSLKRRGERI